MINKKFKFILFLILSVGCLNAAVNLSNTSTPSIYPQIAVDNLNQIHVVWVEMTHGRRGDVYYITYNGQAWSAPANISNSHNVNMGGTYLNLAIDCDPNNRIYVIWNETNRVYLRTKSGSKWGSKGLVANSSATIDGLRLSVYDYNHLALCWWNTGGSYARARINGSWESIRKVNAGDARAKFPDIHFGKNSVYMVWVKKSGDYRTYFSRRGVNFNAAWSNGKMVHNDNHSHSFPRVTITSSNVTYASFLSYHDGPKFFKCSTTTGTNFSSPSHVSNLATIHFPSLYARGNTIYAAWQQGAYEHGQGYFYAVNAGQGWSSPNKTDDSKNAKSGDIAAAPNNSKFYVVWDANGEVYIHGSGSEAPAPIPNKPPRAKFTYHPYEGLYPLDVNFNAGPSSDSDGKIVSYKWTFGDGTSGSGKTIGHTFTKKGTYEITLKVTDDDSASDTSSAMVIVVGIQPPVNVKYELLENRSLFFIEYLYKVTWNKNPVNLEWGSNVVEYKIYRKKTGDVNYSYFATVKAEDNN